jgi:quercetin dioxygenase-like cupin family protein
MGRISITSLSDAPTRDSGDAAHGAAPPFEWTRRQLFPSAGEALELIEVTLGPDAEVEAHGHASPEIIFVTAGELRFGARVCAPGTAVHVDADTLYGFRAGPAGVTFLNFRSEPGSVVLSKEEVLERLAARRA